MRQHRWIRRAVPVVGAVCAVAVAAPAATALEKPRPYETSQDAKSVKGTSSSADAPGIVPGLHTDTIRPGEEKFYSVNLDAKSSAHFTATALPRPGSKVGMQDGIEVELQNTNGDSCGEEEVGVRGETAYPLTGLASRIIGKDDDEECAEKGPYLLRVKRAEAQGSSPAAWPVELSYVEEPGLKGSIPAPRPGTDEETDENNKRPAPPTGEAKTAKGGTGFNDARAIGTGVWKDRLQPGETRYYRVPVDWGQRLYARMEIPNAAKSDSGSTYIPNAYRMNLFNTARASLYSEEFQSYTGEGGKFDRYTNPVRYENRFADEASHTRFGGWYYVAVTANAEMAEAFPKGTPVTLRVAVKGDPKDAPKYDGDAASAGIGVSDDDREMADKGLTAAEADKSDTMKTLGYVGIGAGAALIVVLAAWLLLARRRAAPAAQGGQWPPQPPQNGYGGQSPYVGPGQAGPGPGAQGQGGTPVGGQGPYQPYS